MRTMILAALAASALATPAFAQRQDAPFSGPRAEAVLGLDIVVDRDADEGYNGLLYGGAIGYDYQTNGVVFGVEGEITGSTVKATATDVLVAGDTMRSTPGRDLYAGVRIGGLVTPNTLVYAKGGYTNARIDADYTAGSTTLSDSENLDGYRLGAGVEQRLTGNVYVKGEYRFSHYGSGNDFDANVNRHQIVGGVGIRF